GWLVMGRHQLGRGGRFIAAARNGSVLGRVHELARRPGRLFVRATTRHEHQRQQNKNRADNQLHSCSPSSKLSKKSISHLAKALESTTVPSARPAKACRINQSLGGMIGVSNAVSMVTAVVPKSML